MVEIQIVFVYNISVMYAWYIKFDISQKVGIKNIIGEKMLIEKGG